LSGWTSPDLARFVCISNRHPKRGRNIIKLAYSDGKKSAACFSLYIGQIWIKYFIQVVDINQKTRQGVLIIAKFGIPINYG